MTSHVAAEHRRRARWAAVAVALAIVAAVLLGAVLLRPSGPAPGPNAGPVPPRSTAVLAGSATTPARSPTPARPSPPVHLSIPAIGVSQRLLRLGLHKDRTVEVPSPADAEYPGWYELGTAPGQLGSAVILGHVDSLSGPAVFYELRSLVPGDRVDVRLRDGSVAHFAVRDVATYANREFPSRRVYAARGFRGLNLVTCGGAYDRARGGYQSNVVAYTRWTGTSPAA